LTGQFDVKTAFLYSLLEEAIWITLPEGYAEYLKEFCGIITDPNLYCVKILKAICGLIQASRQWWKGFKAAMLKWNYHPSLADPCHFIRKERSVNV
jgi:hypothetical protein